MTRERVFLQKMNLTLVYVLKNEWPHNWPEFIDEIVQASTTNEVQLSRDVSFNLLVMIGLNSPSLFSFLCLTHTLRVCLSDDVRHSARTT